MRGGSLLLFFLCVWQVVNLDTDIILLPPMQMIWFWVANKILLSLFSNCDTDSNKYWFLLVACKEKDQNYSLNLWDWSIITGINLVTVTVCHNSMFRFHLAPNTRFFEIFANFIFLRFFEIFIFSYRRVASQIGSDSIQKDQNSFANEKLSERRLWTALITFSNAFYRMEYWSENQWKNRKKIEKIGSIQVLGSIQYFYR